MMWRTYKSGTGMGFRSKFGHRFARCLTPHGMSSEGKDLQVRLGGSD